MKRDAGCVRRNLDPHRASGLWLWLVLLTLATSGVAMNLPERVFRSVVSSFSHLKPSLNEITARRYEGHAVPETLSFDDAVAGAHREGSRRGWRVTPLYVFHYPQYSTYGVAFARDGASGKVGLGPSFYYFDDHSGALVRSRDCFGRLAFGHGLLHARPDRSAVQVIICARRTDRRA